MLEVVGAEVHYHKVAALKGLSLAVPEGGIVTIIGANGAGKSTTLRAISGLVKLSAGEIRHRARRIDGLAPEKLVALGIAQVPEGRRVFPGPPRGLQRRPQAPGGGIAGGGSQALTSGPMTWRNPNLVRLAAPALTVMVALAGAGVGASAAAAASEDEVVARHSRALIVGADVDFRNALGVLRTRGNPDVAAAMILALRYRRTAVRELSKALEEVTGHAALGWFDWMLWQEAHPEIEPHPSFIELKLETFRRVDPNFLYFFRHDWAEPKNMKIRLEEITWGGVAVDGIPSLDDPKLIAATAADYLRDDDLVFGVEINGDARAYPLRIMGWHEMFNEVIGGVPVALAYCTLCGSGILFETRVEGRERPFVFGSSGLLYRSNKLMFDRETDSLWNQFTGRPVVGPLVESGIALEIRPVVIATWAKWRAAHPQSRVLSLDTGHRRDYGSGVVYKEYFASPDLMFPTRADESRLRRKDYVFGIRGVGAAKAWPITAFAGGAVINDAVGNRAVVLIGNAETRSVRAYQRGARRFEATAEEHRLRGPGGSWRVTEEALLGPGGTRLTRVPGHLAYWFAWDGYLGVQSELYQPPE